MILFDSTANKFHIRHGGRKNRKAVLIAICQNIIDNHGELIPLKDYDDNVYIYFVAGFLIGILAGLVALL